MIVDGAQLVPHKKVCMCQVDSSENIDFLVLGMLCLSSREKGCMKKTHSERLWVLLIRKLFEKRHTAFLLLS